MAGERKGDVFEALIFLALEANGYVHERDMFWGVKPKGFSIDPDFLLGSVEAPTHWILATNSGSAKNSLEKFWRNIGEITEAKRVCRLPPKIVNLVLESNQRDALREAMSAIADSEIVIGRTTYGSDLNRIVDQLLPSVTGSKKDKVNFLRKEIASKSDFSRVFSTFKKELRSAIKSDRNDLEGLWKLTRAEPRRLEYRKARETFVRRGLAKLMLIPAAERRALYEHVLHKGSLPQLPKYAYALNFALNTLRGPILIDNQILWVVKKLPPSVIEDVLVSSYNARPANWSNWINVLHSADIGVNHDFVVKKYTDLISPQGMLCHLKTHSPSGYKWLFAHLMEILKAHSGKKQGYGYSVLAKDVGYASGISQGYLELSDWVNGFLDHPKSKNLIPDVALALSKRLKGIPITDIVKMASTIESSYLNNFLEQKVVSYWLFEPLNLLIKSNLSRAGMTVASVKKHPTFIGEFVGKPTQVASPQVLICGNTLICSKSAYELGKHHKTKELSGRGTALRFSFENGRFSRRSSVKKMILVLDGTFTDAHLKSLIDSGWDEIFYSDELDDLAASIV